MTLTGRQKRHQSIRKKLTGTNERPRLCVFRSNKHIYAQVIDDTKHNVLLGYSSSELKGLKNKNKTEIATEVGKTIGKLAIEKGITHVAFDRAGYKYHGRVKALADGARAAGLKF
ncbi:MAG: 50S ribosomal protein L18 [candidate division WOR-3 bacterium]|nr:MAG: 50S ribosomal protein L18 [candidate division WOR-3 bacterium]